MPQMSPINWLTMFIMFILIFSIIMSKIYFHKQMKETQLKMNLSDQPLNSNNWVW